MVFINIVTWAFTAYLVAFFGTWVYAVLWMIVSIVRGEFPFDKNTWFCADAKAAPTIIPAEGKK